MKKINTINAPMPVGPYSQAVVSGNFIYVSGQVAINPETNQIEAKDIINQTKQIFENISNILLEANSNINKIIKTTCFLTNLDYFKDFNNVYSEYITNNPARSTIEVSKLPLNALVEIEVIAEIKND